MSIQRHTVRTDAFTLVELMVVVAIMALLAALTIGAFEYAQVSAARNRTAATHAAVMAGLERYNAEFGEYPEPTSQTAADFGGKNYTAGGAAMLYQAMSGDGTDAIKLGSGGSTPSNGDIEDSEEGNIMMSDMPKEIWMEVNSRYYIVDGFRKPFQYTKGGDPNAVNPTYDLWSFGQDEENIQAESVEQKTNPSVNAKWIKNW